MSDLVIGIEVHVQLLSATKMFCGCKNSFGDEPNEMCPVCLQIANALPIVNESSNGPPACLALNCKINEVAPDTEKLFLSGPSKGYQITQYTTPLGQKDP